MAAFRYEALDAAGKISYGVIEADGLRQARTHLREASLRVVSVHPVTEQSLHTGEGQRWRWRPLPKPGRVDCH